VSGDFEECLTPDGVADLSGNLWEWIADGEDHGPDPGFHVRGGAYTSGLNTLRCQGTLGGVGPLSHARVIGFRCCRNAVPE
jgi:formylglycine-generating enzyme required for sulfatase activity